MERAWAITVVQQGKLPLTFVQDMVICEQRLYAQERMCRLAGKTKYCSPALC